MPDKQKLKVLEDHGVRLVKTCGSCVHSTFPHGRPWGSCDLATYQHEKHEGVRPMPAHLMFVCPSHEDGPNGMELGEYAQLIPELDDDRLSPEQWDDLVRILNDPKKAPNWVRKALHDHKETTLQRLQTAPSQRKPVPQPAIGRMGEHKCPKCSSLNVKDASQSLDCYDCGHSW